MQAVREVVVFACTRGAKEDTDLYRSMSRGALEHVHFAEHNREGLPVQYNRFLGEYAGKDKIAVLAHDDVAIEDPFILEKLSLGAERFAIQGLAGAASFDLQSAALQTLWIRAPREHLSGAVEHVISPSQTSWSAYGPVPQACVVLDGLFLAIDLSQIGSVRFDERFAFHFYDLDFCLSAHRAQLSLGTVNVHARHRSGGTFDSADFFAAQARFREKWAPPR